MPLYKKNGLYDQKAVGSGDAMKISELRIENFKRFEKIEIDFKNSLTEDISDKFIILGDNGVGKTTVLQAIALCLSKCSGKIKNVSEFDWPGWRADRYGKWGIPLIEMKIHFTDKEITKTREIAEQWCNFTNPTETIIPGENKTLTLRLSGEWYEALGEDGQTSQANLFQLKGRYYAIQLLRTSPRARDYFDYLPGFFWFDQFRNLAVCRIGRFRGDF